MLKLEDILKILNTVCNKYDNIRVGVAGSYANGTQTPNSDIDIVIDGDSTQVEIMEFVKSLFEITVDVLWVDLMQKEDNELDQLAIDFDLPINNNSVYKTVMREVVWV